MIREIFIALFLITGSFLIFLSGLGLQRFSDALCRSHALAKASTCGICLMLGALLLALDNEITGLKIFLVMLFTLLTIPLASHLTALLVYRFENRQPPDERQTINPKGENGPVAPDQGGGRRES